MKKKISKIINERFLFINKKKIQNKLTIKAKDRYEAMFVLGKKGKNVKRLANIISRKMEKSVRITVDW